MLHLLVANEFDGAVIELWMTATSISDREADTDLMLEAVDTWARLFHDNSLLIVAPVPPPVDPRPHRPLFSRQHFKTLAQSILHYRHDMTIRVAMPSPLSAGSRIASRHCSSRMTIWRHNC